ncbi:MAG: metallophosphoesterase, partial [Planctomycetota bacterium]
MKCLKKRAWAQQKPTKDLLKKRRAIEVGHSEAWLTLGKGTFHFENLSFLRRSLTWFFRLLNVLERGEKNALDIQVNPVRFEFENLPKAFDGYKILHLSDLHIDGLAGLTETICGKIQGLEYDLCLLSGDYRFEIYGPFHNVAHHMGILIDAIEAPDGIIGILGNHDFLEASNILENFGVNMLINQAVPIERGDDCLWMVGLDDPHYYGCDDLPGALRTVPESAFKVLAVHSPELYSEA